MIIGVMGYAYSGKDTFCKLLQECLPGVKRYAFADALKEEVADRYCTTVKNIEENKQEYRQRLQEWGVSRRVNSWPDYWVDCVRGCIEHDKPAIACITDCRFPNEADWIKSTGGLLVRIVRGTPVNGHESETALDGYRADYTIDNSGTLNKFDRRVSTFSSFVQGYMVNENKLAA